MTDYQTYLASQEWRRRRRAYLRKHPACERCGMAMKEHKSRFGGLPLHVHHRSYERIGRELDQDLETLCQPCHEQEENYAEEYPAGDVSFAVDDLGIELRPEQLPQAPAEETYFDSPPEIYWAQALKRIDRRVRLVADLPSRMWGLDSEKVWQELERMARLERYARICMELETKPEEAP